VTAFRFLSLLLCIDFILFVCKTFSKVYFSSWITTSIICTVATSARSSRTFAKAITMSSNANPDVSQGPRQIRASVLHGAKDLRIVRDLNRQGNPHADRKRRRADPSFLPVQQTSRSVSEAPVSAAQICITTDITAMATSSFKNPCPWAMSRQAWLLV
jgi:hypothetical protein